MQTLQSDLHFGCITTQWWCDIDKKDLMFIRRDSSAVQESTNWFTVEKSYCKPIDAWNCRKKEVLPSFGNGRQNVTYICKKTTTFSSRSLKNSYTLSWPLCVVCIERLWAIKVICRSSYVLRQSFPNLDWRPKWIADMSIHFPCSRFLTRCKFSVHKWRP